MAENRANSCHRGASVSVVCAVDGFIGRGLAHMLRCISAVTTKERKSLLEVIACLELQDTTACAATLGTCACKSTLPLPASASCLKVIYCDVGDSCLLQRCVYGMSAPVGSQP